MRQYRCIQGYIFFASLVYAVLQSFLFQLITSTVLFLNAIPDLVLADE